MSVPTWTPGGDDLSGGGSGPQGPKWLRVLATILFLLVMAAIALNIARGKL